MVGKRKAPSYIFKQRRDSNENEDILLIDKKGYTNAIPDDVILGLE